VPQLSAVQSEQLKQRLSGYAVRYVLHDTRDNQPEGGGTID